MRTINALSIITLLTVLTISACSESDRAWDKAEQTNTIDAYLSFEQTYPESSHATKAADAARSLKWVQATKNKSLEEVETYIKEYPNASNIDQARSTLKEYAYDAEIGSLNQVVKVFLNGNTKDNTISSLNGFPFEEMDQNPSPMFSFVDNENFRIDAKLHNKKTGKLLSITYQPKPNQMIESVESIKPVEGVTITFNNGHKYEYTQGQWKRKI